MLITYGQFQLQQAVKSSAHLLHPRTVLQKNVRMPRHSLIHLLDLSNEEKFPARDIYHLNGIPNNKRVPILHIRDLKEKQEVQMLQDRYLDKSIRIWQRENMQKFRPWELLDVTNPDQLTNGVINYNPIKNLYKHKSTLTSTLSRYTNVMKTYWMTISEAIEKNPQLNHFAKIEVPKAIPSRMILEKISQMSDVRYARVVTSHELNGIIQLYRYLDPTQREKSTMASLTHEQTQNLTIELSYQGYSVFFKLSYLVALHEASELASKTKMNTERLHKLFLVMLLKMQKIVEEKLTGENADLRLEDEMDAQAGEQDTDTVVIGRKIGSDQDTQADEHETNSPEQQAIMQQAENELMSKFKHDASDIKKPDAAAFKTLDKEIDTSFDTPEADALDKLIESGLSDLEGGTDDLFIKAVAQASTVVDHAEIEQGDESKQTVNIHEVDYSDENIQKLLREPTIDERFEAYIQEAKGFDAISSAEVRTLRKTYEKRKELKAPYANQQIDEFSQVTPEELSVPKEQLPIKNDLVADHLKFEVLSKIDKKYIQGPMRKHIVASVTAFEKSGIIVKDYQVEEVSSSIGRYEVHKLSLKPLKGKESQVYFRIPVIDDEGEFVAGNVRYRMRKQRSDQVVRKISPTKVGVTTNYGKLFIYRTERRAFDPYTAISEMIKKDYLDGKGNIIKIAPGNRYKNEIKTPNMYAAMSRNFNDIKTPTHHLYFNYDEITNHIDAKVHEDIRKQDMVFVGHNKQNHILVMDNAERILNYSNNLSYEGTLEEICQLDKEKIPSAFSAIKILGDAIPLGVMLSYYMGLKNLVAVTRSRMTIEGRNSRGSGSNNPHTVYLRFGDCKLKIDCPNATAALLFSGFLFYKNFIKDYPLESFYSQNIYLDLLEFRDAGLMHLKEMDMLRDQFLDPISIDALKASGEPTEFLPLILYANSLLENFQHLDINDPTKVRIRSYDRVPGLIYRALSESVRTYRMKGGKGKIELDPYKVWKYVTQDTTVKVTEDNNPITDVKEMEAATFTGIDGLSRTATPEKLRKYHKKDSGLVSEATVDSTDVALNFSLSPYAKIKSLLGDVDIESKEHEEHPDKIFSSSILLTPMGEYDD